MDCAVGSAESTPRGVSAPPLNSWLDLGGTVIATKRERCNREDWCAGISELRFVSLKWWLRGFVK
ncbi:MAG TPA: hypothetical protein DCY79_12365 [Planctomycetaceae bacterium]|nr:hypothetical protein [Planctomycetaceae bacterium]